MLENIPKEYHKWLTCSWEESWIFEVSFEALEQYNNSIAKAFKIFQLSAPCHSDEYHIYLRAGVNKSNDLSRYELYFMFPHFEDSHGAVLHSLALFMDDLCYLFYTRQDNATLDYYRIDEELLVFHVEMEYDYYYNLKKCLL